MSTYFVEWKARTQMGVSDILITLELSILKKIIIIKIIIIINVQRLFWVIVTILPD